MAHVIISFVWQVFLYFLKHELLEFELNTFSHTNVLCLIWILFGEKNLKTGAQSFILAEFWPSLLRRIALIQPHWRLSRHELPVLGPILYVWLSCGCIYLPHHCVWWSSWRLLPALRYPNRRRDLEDTQTEQQHAYERGPAWTNADVT